MASSPQIVLTLMGDNVTLLVQQQHTVLQSLELLPLTSVLACLRHQPVTPDDLERAIAVIEEAIMPPLRQIPTSMELWCTNPTLWQLLTLLHQQQPPATQLNIATIEEFFNRLADRAYGLPLRDLTVPHTPQDIAWLLIVREVLHHGRFAVVQNNIIH